LVTRFRLLEACFDIVDLLHTCIAVSDSSNPNDPTLKASPRARPPISLTCCSIFSFYSS
jgi:hypothetical protein